MRAPSKFIVVFFSVALAAVACGGGGGDGGESGAGRERPAGGQGALPDLSQPCRDPLGNEATPAGEIALTPQEMAEIRRGEHSAAVTWAGSGPWYEAADSGFDDALEELGIERVASASAEYDAAKQASDVENAMALDPDVVLGSPVDAVAAAEAYRPVVDADKVLVLSDNIPDGYAAGRDYVAFVAGNRCESGQLMADLMADAIGGSGKIGMIHYDADFFVTNVLDDHFRAAIAQGYPEIEIAVESGFAEEGGTEEVAEAMLLQNPDLEGIYVTWSAAAQGVIAAIREAGRDDVKVVTHDLDAVNDVLIAEGEILHGTAIEDVYDIGYRLGLLAGYGLLGKDAPPYVAVDMRAVTRENLAEAWRETYGREPPAEVAEALER